MKKTLLGMMCFFASAFAIKAQTLYGTTFFGGSGGGGTINKYIPSTNNLTVVKSLEDYETSLYYTNFVQASDGKLYGMTSDGGRNNYGTIFSFDPSSSTYTRLKDFDDTDGASPDGSLMQASDGKLYGMTRLGGKRDYGVIFSFDPSSSTYTKLKNFDSTNGARPFGSLIQASNGMLYGMTNMGGSSNAGVIFSFDPSSSTLIKLEDFDRTNGASPREQNLAQASDGKLYGMTYAGGSDGVGVIFSFDPSSLTYTKLKDFDGTDGANPKGSLIQAKDGKLYGMTYTGGTSGRGVIFSFDLSLSIYTKLKDFDNSLDGPGRYPIGSLVQSSDGELYGMTSEGGNNNYGVIFTFDPTSFTYTNIKNFNDVDGSTPTGSLIQTSDGKLYGRTLRGGVMRRGVIFSLDPATRVYTKIKDFGTNETGINFSGSLIEASDGKLYGMTNGGGSSGRGAIYSFDPFSSTYTKLKDFDGANGGNEEYGDILRIYGYGHLIQARDGKLYGMTYAGGNRDYGVIFSFDPSSSTYTKLKDFDFTNGAHPYGSLMQASDGKLYGMTSAGGSNNNGVIFSFDPSSSVYAKLKDFNFTDGIIPYGNLIQANDGKLYGMTSEGGKMLEPPILIFIQGGGVIFSFDPSSSTYTKLKDFDGTNGGTPHGSLVQANDGKLYGMTSFGGSISNSGVIFSIDPSSSIYTKLMDFNYSNGYYPSGSLIQASDRKLYGMTYSGGSSNLGVIFSFDPSSSTYTKLIDYNGADGANPSSGSAFIELREAICPPPVIQCNADTTMNVEAGKCGATVNYNAPVVTDACENTSVTQILGFASGSLFPVGVTTNTFVATSSSGQKDTCSFTVTVLDKEPPVITDVSASPSSLWPANHQMKDVTINYNASDNCGTVSSSLSVSSNEPVDGTGDGDTSPDWIVVNDHHVQLRAERSGKSNERVYTITITSTDASGNTSTQTTQVEVPHNRNPKMDYVNQLFDCKVIPNPSSNYFELQVKSGSDEKIVVNLYDTRGRLLAKMNAAKNQSLHFGSNLRPGTYMVEVIQGQQHQRIYLIKQ